MEKEHYVFLKSNLYKQIGFKAKLLERQQLGILKDKYIMVTLKISEDMEMVTCFLMMVVNMKVSLMKEN